MPTRNLFADDHAVVRSGLRTLIDESPDLVVVAEAGDGDQLAAAMATRQPDACTGTGVPVLCTCTGADLRMPNLEAVAATRYPSATYPHLRYLPSACAWPMQAGPQNPTTGADVMDEMIRDPAYVVGLLAAGAAGYALKDEASDTLVTAIRAVARGERWVAQRVAQKLARKPEEPHSAGGTPHRPRARDL